MSNNNVSFGFDKLKNITEEQKELLDTVLLRRLQYNGVEGVGHARMKGAYKDRTGNLRNSIGFKLRQNSEELAKSVIAETNPVPANGDANKGQANPSMAAQESRNRLDNEDVNVDDFDMSLSVVAGMEYAEYVEKVHSLNVLEETKKQTVINVRSDIDEVIDLSIRKWRLR